MGFIVYNICILIFFSLDKVQYVRRPETGAPSPRPQEFWDSKTTSIEVVPSVD